MKRPLSPERLGRVGENEFEDLCNKADLIANKSEIDLMGWDYRTELPYPTPIIGEKLDARPHPLEANVQVKTVWEGKDHISLSLSAAERLAKARLPSFIVAFTVDGTKTVTGMYVFHMLNRHLERVLKQLRKATAEGKGLEINRIEISFTLKSGVKLAVEGDALRNFMLEAVDDDIDAYYSKKQSQLANLGFGTLRYQGKFKVKAKSEKDISEMFLGLRPMEVVAFEAHEVRFGIKLPDFSSQSGTVSIMPRSLDCKVVAKKGAPSASVPGKLYVSPPLPATGGSAFRVTMDFLELVSDGSKLTFIPKNNDLWTVLVPAPDLLTALRLNYILAEGGEHLAVSVRGKVLWQSPFELPVDDKERSFSRKRVQLVEMACKVFKAAGERNQLVSLSALVDNVDDITVLADLLANDKTTSIAPLVFTPAEDVTLPPISEALLLKKVAFPNFSIAFYAVVEVTLITRPTDTLVEIGAISLRDISFLDPTEDAFEAYMEEARLMSGLAMTMVFQELAKIDPHSLPCT